MKTYDITVTREGRWWMVSIPELDGLTQARRLAEAGQMAREWIALSIDAALSEVEVNIVQVDVAGLEVHAVGELVGQLRGEVRQLEDTIAGLTAATAQQLVDEGVPMRDVAEIVGVSHQRVAQIVTPREIDIKPESVAAMIILATAMAAAFEPMRRQQAEIAKQMAPFLEKQAEINAAVAPLAARMANWQKVSAGGLARAATIAQGKAKN